MITARTPAKKATDKTPPRETDGEKAGPSRTTPPDQTSKVRRSIEGWENTLADPKPCTSTSHAHMTYSPKKTASAPGAPQKQRAKPAPLPEPKTNRRASVETAAVSPGPKLEAVRTADRVTQARIWLQRAKTQIGESRNLRADLKSGITLAVDKLYQLVKEATADTNSTSAAPGKERKTEMSKDIESGRERERQKSDSVVPRIDDKELIELVKEQSRKIDQTNEELTKLKQSICSYQDTIEKQTTYASIAATSTRNPTTVERKSALHSIVIESKDEAATGDDVMKQVREAVNAKDGWVTVERVRKVKDKKVILGCRTLEERERVKERLKGASDRLNVEDMRNHDPMVILRDVMTHHTDNDIKTALRNQNGVVFRGLDGKDDRLEVKFRRKARNPLMTHVVLRVSPTIYNRMLEKGSVHIDMQRVRVADQSPLVQCSMCLAYGHGRSFCKVEVPKCTHCGGPHTRNQCADFLAAEPPKCCNCVAAKVDNDEHNVYSSDCPVRRRWEALARAKVQYC
ncbi:hypothetical protein ABMA27_014323 [Loxostege sticticalis]|uniref:Gag-like protein n=1 Tax=Loxostege sticticalis TaxID=481309 RepID=A0ABR3I8L2_LOXSC